MLNQILLFLLFSSGPVHDHWSSFRGDGTNISPAKGLPVKWSPTEGIAWRVSVPGYGQSSPLIWKDRVFLTSVDGPNKEKCLITAFDLCGGKMLWKKEYPATQKLKSGPMVSRAAPTGVVDPERLITLFESGEVICLDHQGNELWKRSLTGEYGKWDNNHGLASSLAQDSQMVFVLADHRGESSWLMGINKATGRTTWKIDRKPNSSWTSPIVAKIQDKEQIIISSTGSVEAFSPEEGKPLWKWEGLTGNNIPSPVAAGNRVIIGAGENRMKPDATASARSNCALVIGQDGPAMGWGTKKVISQHASPVVYQGVVYFTTRSGMVHAHDLENGNELFVERLADPCWATPVAAGNRVYFFGKSGATTVYQSGPKGKREGVNRLWDESDFEKRKEEDKKKPENQVKTGSGNPGASRSETPRNESGEKKAPAPPKTGENPKTQKGPPAIPPDQARAMGYEAVGDVVYGVAAVDGLWIVRTGTELICIRHGAQP